MHGLGRRFARCCVLAADDARGRVRPGTVAGIVKDSSGAVLPGVTVEASSPALIEKVRSVITDGTGQYKIVDLRPGVYDVTFTLQGFSAVKRRGHRAGGIVRRHDERRAESRLGHRNRRRHRRIADRRHSERRQAAGPHQGRHRRASGRAEPFRSAVLIPGLRRPACRRRRWTSAAPTTCRTRRDDAREPECGYAGAGRRHCRSANTGVGRAVQQLRAEHRQHAGNRRSITAPSLPSRRSAACASTWCRGRAGTGSAPRHSVPPPIRRSRGTTHTDDLKARGLTAPNSLNQIYDVNFSGGGPSDERSPVVLFVHPFSGQQEQRRRRIREPECRHRGQVDLRGRIRTCRASSR